MPQRDHQFNVPARCELPPHLMTPPDGLGRRESSGGGPGGPATLNFEHDGAAMIGWNSTTAGAYYFTTMPSGGALAGSYTSGTTTTWVRLLDLDGSTLDLVNAANVDSGPVTTYTYDPSGNPSFTGAANDWPFQFKGMEKEYTDPGTYYYSGGGQFYSPQLVRSLSETSATSTQGGGGAPPSQLAYGPGSEGNGSFGHWLAHEEEVQATGGFYDGGGGDSADSADAGDSVDVDVDVPIVAIFEWWASFFEWLFGGSSAPPTPRKLLHARHPLYPDIIGVPDGLIPDEAPATPKGMTGGPAPKPKTGGVAPTRIVPTGLISVQFDIVPYEEPLPLDKEPFYYPTPFSRPITYSRCLDAAEHPVLWTNLCNDMPNSVLKAACWSNQSVEEKRGFCRDLFEV